MLRYVSLSGRLQRLRLFLSLGMGVSRTHALKGRSCVLKLVAIEVVSVLECSLHLHSFCDDNFNYFLVK